MSYRKCDCSVGDHCPQGKTGSMAACWINVKDEQVSEEKTVKGVGIRGDDDNAHFVVGRVEPAFYTEKPTEEEKKYMENVKIALSKNPHARKDKTEEWDMKPKSDNPVKDTGLRYDTGKNRLELIPPEWDWALGDVLTQGAKKYAERNWEKGMAWSKMVGCAKRHLLKFEAGERYDEGETGCHHLAMAAWNLLALMTYDLREIGENDMPAVQLELFDEVNYNTSSGF